MNKVLQFKRKKNEDLCVCVMLQMVSMSCLSLIYFLTLVGVVVSKSTPRIGR